MTERLNLQPEEQNPIRNLEVGETFKPFEGIKELPEMKPIVLGPDWHKERQELLNIPFTFKGIRGSVGLLPEPKCDEEDEILSLIGDEKITPLGKTTLVKSFDNNTVTVEQAPLSLKIQFSPISTFEQLYEVEKHLIEVSLGDKRYYARSSTAMPEILSEPGREIVKSAMDKTGRELLYSYRHLEDLEGFKGFREPKNWHFITTILLPHDISKISQIELRILEKKTLLS